MITASVRRIRREVGSLGIYFRDNESGLWDNMGMCNSTWKKLNMTMTFVMCKEIGLSITFLRKENQSVTQILTLADTHLLQKMILF